MKVDIARPPAGFESAIPNAAGFDMLSRLHMIGLVSRRPAARSCMQMQPQR